MTKVIEGTVFTIEVTNAGDVYSKLAKYKLGPKSISSNPPIPIPNEKILYFEGFESSDRSPMRKKISQSLKS